MPKCCEPLRLIDMLNEYNQRNIRVDWCMRNQTNVAMGHLVQALGNRRIDAIDRRDGEDFQAYLIRVKGLSRTTADSYVRAIRSAFGWSAKRQMIASDPWVGIQYFREAPQIRVYTRNEQRDLIQAARTVCAQARLLAGLTAGLRRGEVLNLTWQDVDWENRTLLIQRKVQSRDRWSWQPKNGKRREVPLTDDLAHCLIRLQTTLPVHQPYIMLSSRKYQCLREQIGRIPDRIRSCPDENYSRWFKKTCEDAHVKDGTFHDCRRTCLTAWSRAISPQELMALAGHSSVKTTMLYYLAVGPDSMERAKKATSLQVAIQQAGGSLRAD